MYYVLREKPQGSTEDLAVIETCPTVPGIRSWHLGRKIEKPVPVPLTFELHPHYPGRMPDFFDETIPLFSNKLFTALNDMGVENIEGFQAVLVDGDDKVVSDQYQAVNVVGVVAAADLAASKVADGTAPTLIDTSFDSLAIDPNKARGQLMFRLAEDVSAIIVHQSVKDHLTDNRFGDLGFVEPKDWMSL